MNLAQKILPFLYPLSLVMSLLSLTLLALILNRRWLAACGIISTLAILFISAKWGISLKYIASLEEKYPPILERSTVDSWTQKTGRPLEFIVILGAGGIYFPEHPISSQIPMPGVVRVAEGVRWWHEYPQSKILVSGGPALRGSTEAEMMKKLCIQLGVPSDQVDLDPLSKSSDEQIEVLSKKLEGKTFLLITSAHKLSRIARGFETKGSLFLPVPTDYVNKQPDLRWGGVADHPWAENVGHAELATKETLGSLWRKWKYNE